MVRHIVVRVWGTSLSVAGLVVVGRAVCRQAVEVERKMCVLWDMIEQVVGKRATAWEGKRPRRATCRGSALEDLFPALHVWTAETVVAEAGPSECGEEAPSYCLMSFSSLGAISDRISARDLVLARKCTVGEGQNTSTRWG